MRDEFVLAQQLGDIHRCCGEAVAVQQLEARVDDLNLAGPLGLIAGDADLLTRDELGIVGLGAGHVVQEVGTVLVLGVDRGLVLPPALLGLDIGLDTDRIVHRGGGEVGIAHDGDFGGLFGGFFGRGGFLRGGLFGSRGLRGGGFFRCGGSLRSDRSLGGGGLRALSAGGQGKHHDQRENQCKILFHVLPPCLR